MQRLSLPSIRNTFEISRLENASGWYDVPLSPLVVQLLLAEHFPARDKVFVNVGEREPAAGNCRISFSSIGRRYHDSPHLLPVTETKPAYIYAGGHSVKCNVSRIYARRGMIAAETAHADSARVEQRDFCRTAIG